MLRFDWKIDRLKRGSSSVRFMRFDANSNVKHGGRVSQCILVPPAALLATGIVIERRVIRLINRIAWAGYTCTIRPYHDVNS